MFRLSPWRSWSSSHPSQEDTPHPPRTGRPPWPVLRGRTEAGDDRRVSDVYRSRPGATVWMSTPHLPRQRSGLPHDTESAGHGKSHGWVSGRTEDSGEGSCAGFESRGVDKVEV